MERHKRRKTNIRYWQFERGYAQVEETQLQALLEGYRLGLFRRNEVRVYAARLEFAARHPNTKRLQLARILNRNSHRKGNRRLSASQIAEAAQKLDRHLPGLQSGFASSEPADKPITRKPVARMVLRHVASGGATTVEALLCFAYFMRRIMQRKPMQRLLPEERYARFTYAEFETWTGVHRASQCRMMRRLIERGFLSTVPVVKQNENAYGQLFVDGPVISLTRREAATRRQMRPRPFCCDKRSTPPREKVNAPLQKKSTLRNANLKREIEEQERFVSNLKSGYLGRNGDPELRRIAARATRMVENQLRQAA